MKYSFLLVKNHFSVQHDGDPFGDPGEATDPFMGCNSDLYALCQYDCVAGTMVNGKFERAF